MDQNGEYDGKYGDFSRDGNLSQKALTQVMKIQFFKSLKYYRVAKGLEYTRVGRRHPGWSIFLM